MVNFFLNQEITSYNVFFTQLIYFKIDLLAWSIIEMCMKYHKGFNILISYLSKALKKASYSKTQKRSS